MTCDANYTNLHRGNHHLFKTNYTIPDSLVLEKEKLVRNKEDLVKDKNMLKKQVSDLDEKLQNSCPSTRNLGFGDQLEMYAAGNEDVSSSLSTDCSGFSLQSSIDCSRMVNQSESSCQVFSICYKVGPWSKYYCCVLMMN